MNVVTACKSCNHRKGNRTPEQAHMGLLYTPYVPSLWKTSSCATAAFWRTRWSS